MSQTLTLLSMVLASLATLGLGAALILSPRRVLDVNDRLAQLDRWTTLKRGASTEGLTSYRVLGGMIAIFAGVCLFYLIPALLGLRRYDVTHPQSPSPTAGGMSWSAIALCLLVAILGVLLLLRPTVVERSAIRILQQRRDVGDIKMGKNSLIFFRLLGAAFLLYAILQLLNQFRYA